MVFEDNSPYLGITSRCESSSSSDSYSYLLQNLEDPENTVKDEWEAIERTLYRESGKQVKNVALLKECRLWAETFPHLRVQGTQIQESRAKNIEEKGVGPESHVTKYVQTSNAQPSWVRLNQQRESIKKEVVSQLVQRLISKFNLSKENPAGILQYFDKIDLEKSNEEKNRTITSNGPKATDKTEMEYYFERGKFETKNLEFKNETKELVKKKEKYLKRNDYSDLSDNLEKEFNVRFLSNSMINEKNNLLKLFNKSYKNGHSRNEKFVNKKQEKKEIKPYGLKKDEVLKNEKTVLKIKESPKSRKIEINKSSPTDSLSSLAKSFEPSKKIDKKYEVLLESILKNKGFDFSESSATVSKIENSKSEVKMKNEKESRKKIRINANYDEYTKRHKQLPKINNFTNNWISRTDNVSFKEFDTIMQEFKKEQPVRTAKVSASSSALQVARNNCTSKSGSPIETIKGSCARVEKLKKYGDGTKEKYDVDDIKVQRHESFIRSNANIVPNTLKSSSCGDLNRRKHTSTNFNGKIMKSATEKKKIDVVCRNSSRANLGKWKNTSKTNFTRDVNLPQIETGIIITELNGRPKMPAKIQPRKYL